MGSRDDEFDETSCEVECPVCKKSFRPEAFSSADPRCPACGSAVRGSSTVTGSFARRRFGRYEILETLGQGGMGRVWKAWDPELRRTVALKEIRDLHGDGTREERFLREARAAARLRHPGIVTVLDIGVAEGVRFFTTEFVDGGPLSRLLGSRRDPRWVARIVQGVAEALQHAHDQGIVHRDVKPENILLDGEGRPRLADFGLASDRGDLEARRLTRSGVAMGTPYYMSPEQAQGGTHRLGPASDQFSLGIVLYEVLTGTHPFETEDLLELQRRIVEADPVSPRRLAPKIDRDLETICLKMLEKDPARRYPSAAAVAADLGRWQDGEPIAGRRRGPLARLGARVRRHPVAAAGFLAALVVSGSMGAVAVRAVARARESESTGAAAQAESAESTARAARRSRALARIEEGRPALDRAVRSLYRTSADPAEIARHLAEARSRVEAARSEDPDLALASYLVGLSWRLEGFDDRAEAEWRRALELDRASKPALSGLGRLLVERSFLARMVGGAIGRRKSRPEAVALAREGAELLERALAAGGGWSDEAERDAALAFAAWVRDEPDEARRIAREAIERLGESQGAEDFHWLLALGTPGAEAIERCDRAIRIRPTSILPRILRAQKRSEIGDEAGARADLDEVLRIDSRSTVAWINRSFLRADPLEALADAGAAVALEPDNPVAHMARAGPFIALDRLDEALEAVAEAIRLAPGYATAYAVRASILVSRGDAAGALPDLDRAVQLDPDDVDTRLRRAEARLFSLDPRGALADADAALAVEPESADAFYQRAGARMALGELAAARADLDEAIRLRPRHAEAYAGRANVRLGQGDPAGALADAETALSLVAPADRERLGLGPVIATARARLGQRR